MKHWLYTVSIIILSLASCSSQKKLVAETPFTINAPSCQNWVGGRADSGSGITLTLPVESSNSKVMFSEVYFRGQVTKAKFENGVATCRYAKSNKATKIPFELEADEAVIGYVENDDTTVKYFKISGIKEKQALIYPSKARN